MRAFGFYAGIVSLGCFILVGWWALVLTVDWLKEQAEKEYGEGTEL